VLRTPEGRAALGVPDHERVIGLLHLGPPRQEREPPGRAPTGDVVTYLD
jgi:nitroreductase